MGYAIQDSADTTNATIHGMTDPTAEARAAFRLAAAPIERDTRLCDITDAEIDSLLAYALAEAARLRTELARIGWNEVTWKEARDVARAALKTPAVNNLPS